MSIQRTLLTTLALGAAVAGIAVTPAAAPATKPAADYVQRHPRSLDDRTFEVWRKHAVVDSHDMRKGDERLIQIQANPVLPGRNPDHGCSSWLPLKDGRIFLVDYTSRSDPPGKCHLVGVYLDPEDLRDARPAASTRDR